MGLGRRAGVRPQDLVGAISNEAGIPGRAIGAIEITERFSLVEVPSDMAQEISEALRRTKIKGFRPLVKTEHEEPGSRPGGGFRPRVGGCAERVQQPGERAGVHLRL